MKKEIRLPAGKLTAMELDKFKEIMAKKSIVITINGKQLCRVVEPNEDHAEPENILTMNYSEFTRGTKYTIKEFFKNPDAQAKLVTNAHHQIVCYLTS